MLEKQVIKTIQKYNLIENGDSIVCGVSGGPDSIAMLNILNTIRNNGIYNFDLYVAHINHGIRENAKIDAEYVLDYCQKNNIECFVLNADVIKQAKEEKRGLEETGRKVRYEFFDEILKKTDSNKIAIAHNLNDNAETIIMNMVRGTGLSGLKGIEAINGIYIRPLIESKREDIEKYCEDKNLNPRHDESNDDNVYTRNKIRNVAIPYIKSELNPNIVETISRLSEIAKDDINYLNSQTEIAYNNIVIEESFCEENVYNNENESKIILNLKKFNLLDKAIQKRVILHSINKLFGSTQGIEKIHIEDIIKLCNNNIGNKYLTPNKNIKVEIKSKKIFIKSLK